MLSLPLSLLVSLVLSPRGHDRDRRSSSHLLAWCRAPGALVNQVHDHLPSQKKDSCQSPRWRYPRHVLVPGSYVSRNTELENVISPVPQRAVTCMWP